MRSKTTKAARKVSKPEAKAQKKVANEPPIEYDRRGKPLPPRARVGGIITPQ
jgi:hypothetical protein